MLRCRLEDLNSCFEWDVLFGFAHVETPHLYLKRPRVHRFAPHKVKMILKTNLRLVNSSRFQQIDALHSHLPQLSPQSPDKQYQGRVLDLAPQRHSTPDAIAHGWDPRLWDCGNRREVRRPIVLAGFLTSRASLRTQSLGSRDRSKDMYWLLGQHFQKFLGDLPSSGWISKCQCTWQLVLKNLRRFSKHLFHQAFEQTSFYSYLKP